MVPLSRRVKALEAVAEELLLAQVMMGGEVDGGHHMVGLGGAAQDRSEAQIADGHV